jgi:uncharacterized repeat protein (TIGR01451 family)
VNAARVNGEASPSTDQGAAIAASAGSGPVGAERHTPSAELPPAASELLGVHPLPWWTGGVVVDAFLPPSQPRKGILVHSEQRGSHGARSFGVQIALGFVASAALIAVALFALGGSAQGASRACTENNQQGTLCVSVTDTPDAVAYSSFDGNLTYLVYDIVVSNESRSSSLSHVGLTDTLPDGTSLVRAASSRGSCSAVGQVVTCPLGSLKKGQQASAELVVTAPATALADPPDVTITNMASVNFDERFSDQTGGKQDTATASEMTTLSKTAGQTFVPAGLSGKVGTDPAREQYANALIPSASTDVVATLQLLAPDSFCSANGTVRISNKTYICRRGGFVDASVEDADTGERYTNTQHPLVFHLRWGPGLVSDRQTVRNFVVFYQESDGAPVQVFGNTCNASASNAPCLHNVTEAEDGSWSVDLVKPDNGHMR